MDKHHIRGWLAIFCSHSVLHKPKLSAKSWTGFTIIVHQICFLQQYLAVSLHSEITTSLARIDHFLNSSLFVFFLAYNTSYWKGSTAQQLKWVWLRYPDHVQFCVQTTYIWQNRRFSLLDKVHHLVQQEWYLSIPPVHGKTQNLLHSTLHRLNFPPS